MAFKFADEIHETILREINWNTTRTGELVPVAAFDTVNIDGCDISNATLHNISFIEKLELWVGCQILISKRNMIIPNVEDNLDRGEDIAELPTICPSCGKPIKLIVKANDSDNEVTKSLFCKNDRCKSRIIYHLLHFVSKKAMDIEGLSTATLDKFYEYGWLDKVLDLYALEQFREEIITLDGFGETSFANIIKSINKSKITSFERFLVAIDIPMIGISASKELKRYFNDDITLFFNAVMDGFDFTVIEGFGSTLNQNIHDWFSTEGNIKFWKEFLAMVEFENVKGTEGTNEIEVEDNIFKGKTVVATGKIGNFTRDSLHSTLESLGAKVGGSVPKKTDYLIVSDKAGSKLTKANELGVTVMYEPEFLANITARTEG